MRTRTRKFQIIMLALLFPVFGFFSRNSMAQNHIILGYDYSIPLGNTEEYIDANSFRGGSFEFGHHLTERMAIGLKVGLQTFYQELDKDTYTDDNVTIYGKQFRYMNSFPTLATFQYNLVDMENDLITFMRDLIKLPGISCKEEKVAKRIKKEMDTISKKGQTWVFIHSQIFTSGASGFNRSLVF